MRAESERLSASLVVPEAIAEELDAVARRPMETAGVLLASVVLADGAGPRLLVRGLRWVHEASYLRRGADHMTIASEGYVPYLGEAESLGAMAIWLHTHPGERSSPEASHWDRDVDRRLADLFRLRSGSPYYGMVIVAPRREGLVFTGYVHAEGSDAIPVSRCWVVGDRLALLRSFDSPGRLLDAAFDRNVRAFGGGVQEALGQLCVGVVGCGGTGSSVAEQLVRLGVRNFRLFDPDRLSASNVTRVYGSSRRDVGRFKVEALADHMMRIAPDARVRITRATITSEAAARQLCGCDVAFGCTDDNAGRLVLSRVATYLLTPVIDCGVLLSSGADGRLTGIDGRITTLVPGQACLVCRGRIDTARAASELMTPGERKRREDEGYAPALAGVEPAVVTYTTIVAATAVSELLERLIGYGPEPRPSEVLLRCHEREISTNVQHPGPRHYCNPSSGKLGMGLTTPFLEQTWPD